MPVRLSGRGDLKALARLAERIKHSKQVSFRVEGIIWFRCTLPVPLIERTHKRRHDAALVFRAIAQIDWPSLEQANAALAMIGGALGGLGQISEHGWAHIVQFACHRIGNRQRVIDLAEQRRVSFRHEAPADSFQETA
jgi:hypothetical protein